MAAVLLLAGCGSDDGGGGKDAPAKELAPILWSWTTKEPEGRDPVTDETGADCRRNQPKDVFFLAGSGGTTVRRKCTVPAHRRIFAPVHSYNCPFEGEKIDDVIAKCRKHMPGVRRRVTLDGKKFGDIYVESEPYDLKPAPGSQFEPTKGRSVVVGWFLSIEGLDPGRHTLAWTASDANGYRSDIRYDLTAR